MADERLRALERGAQAGDPSSRARLLGERVRVGALRAERLALAALLADPAARLALADAAPAPPAGVAGLVEALERYGREPLVRGALAAATAAAPRWAACFPRDPRLAAALDAARTALDRDDVALLAGHTEAAQALTLVDAAAALPPELAAPPADGVDPAAHEAAYAAALPAANAAVFAARAARAAVWCVSWRLEGASLYSLANYARDALFDAAGAIGEPVVLEAVRADVVAWALG